MALFNFPTLPLGLYSGRRVASFDSTPQLVRASLLLFSDLAIENALQWMGRGDRILMLNELDLTFGFQATVNVSDKSSENCDCRRFDRQTDRLIECPMICSIAIYYLRRSRCLRHVTVVVVSQIIHFSRT